MAQTISSGERPYPTRRRERPKLTPNPNSRLRDQVHEVMRFRHFSERTEETYWQWIVRFLKFYRKGPRPLPGRGGEGKAGGGSPGVSSHHGWRHPKALGAAEVNAFLSHLAAELNVAAATQNQALNALVFLYGEVLHQPLGELGEFARAARSRRVPEVLSRSEVKRVLAAVEADYGLPLRLLYGSGMRLMAA